MLKITPNGSSQCRAKGRGRRVTRRRMCFQGREVVWIDFPKEIQSMLRSERIIRRKREKDLREFKSLKMDPLSCLIGFLQIFVKKIEKLNESVHVSGMEGYDILHRSLPEY